MTAPSRPRVSSTRYAFTRSWKGSRTWADRAWFLARALDQASPFHIRSVPQASKHAVEFQTLSAELGDALGQAAGTSDGRRRPRRTRGRVEGAASSASRSGCPTRQGSCRETRPTVRSERRVPRRSARGSSSSLSRDRGSCVDGSRRFPAERPTLVRVHRLPSARMPSTHSSRSDAKWKRSSTVRSSASLASTCGGQRRVLRRTRRVLVAVHALSSSLPCRPCPAPLATGRGQPPRPRGSPAPCRSARPARTIPGCAHRSQQTPPAQTPGRGVRAWLRPAQRPMRAGPRRTRSRAAAGLPPVSPRYCLT